MTDLLDKDQGETTAIAQSQDGSLIPAARRKEIRQLSQIARQARQEIAECEDDEERAFVIAHGVMALRACFTPGIIRDILSLANTPLGFKTDRAPGSRRDGKEITPYPDIVFKDVLTQALIRGLRITGNEFNIIAGNLYVTKEGLRRLIDTFPGVSGFQYDIGVPKKHGDGGALVPARATWYRGAEKCELICEGEYSLPVRVNEAMGVDAIIGKAESKLWKRAYNRMVGTKDLAIDLDDDASDDKTPETTAS